MKYDVNVTPDDIRRLKVLKERKGRWTDARTVNSHWLHTSSRPALAASRLPKLEDFGFVRRDGDLVSVGLHGPQPELPQYQVTERGLRFLAAMEARERRREKNDNKSRDPGAKKQGA